MFGVKQLEHLLGRACTNMDVPKMTKERLGCLQPPAQLIIKKKIWTLKQEAEMACD